MKKIYVLILTFTISSLSFGQITDVYISMFGEGSSNNKFMEIYNGTDADVDLSQYSISTCSNGCDIARANMVVVLGIVVNNAIVLIDYIDLTIVRKRRELGLEESEKLTPNLLVECVIEGGKTRLRPVILTAITTILGLLPLALGININFRTLITELNPNFYIGGENVAFWGPMGWAIVFGLTFATFLTLVVVPILFYLINKLKTKKVKVTS